MYNVFVSRSAKQTVHHDELTSRRGICSCRRSHRDLSGNLFRRMCHCRFPPTFHIYMLRVVDFTSRCRELFEVSIHKERPRSLHLLAILELYCRGCESSSFELDRWSSSGIRINVYQAHRSLNLSHTYRFSLPFVSGFRFEGKTALFEAAHTIRNILLMIYAERFLFFAEYFGKSGG